MNNTLNLLLQLAISAGIHDRDVFVDKVSTFLQQKMDADPANSEHLGEEVLLILEKLKEELSIDRMVSKINKPGKEISAQLSELTAAINKLNETLQDKKD